VLGAHGLQGEVRLKLFTDDLASYRDILADGRPLTLLKVRGEASAIARFAEIADRDAAEALSGATLSVPRSALPSLEEGEYYHADLIGLPCEVDGVAIGTAVAVENFGAGDILEIEKPDGKRFMVPVAAAVTIEPERLLVDAAFVT
jgi:16S rRNA processing protein RimM